MKVMIFDTSGYECIVSLYIPESGVFYERRSFLKNQHSEALFPLISTIITDACIPFSDISDIAIIVGPGSFTGLRVSLSAAQGFVLTSNIAVHGISILELQAYNVFRSQQKHEGNIVSIIPTPKDNVVFHQIFSSTLFPLTDIQSIALCEVSHENNDIIAPQLKPDSKVVSEYFVHKLTNGLPTTRLLPIYEHSFTWNCSSRS